MDEKLNKEWVKKWIKDPQSFRYNTWMPHFFNQDNNSSPEMIERNNLEIYAMTEYLFKDGSMIGLNEKLLADYIDWIGAKRMRAVGLTCPYTAGRINPLPWTEKWISGRSVQPAPQETEISSYVVGGVKQDVDQEQLSKLSL